MIRSRLLPLALLLLLYLTQCAEPPPPLPLAEAAPRRCVAAAAGSRQPYQGDRGQVADGGCSYYWTPYNFNDPRVIPMLWSPTVRGGDVLDIPGVSDALAENPSGYLLIFNECDQSVQCNTLPRNAAVWFHDVVVPQFAGRTRLVCCNSLRPEWTVQFLEVYRSLYGRLPPLSGLSGHVYPCVDPWIAAAECDSVAEAEQGLLTWIALSHIYYPTAELWLTEVGHLRPDICGTEACGEAYIREIVRFLDSPTGRRVQRVFWYSDHETVPFNALLNLWRGPGELTWTGEVWSGWRPRASWTPDHFLFLPIVPR